MDQDQNQRQQGFPKNKFKEQVGDNFDCLICKNVARVPQECQDCGSIVCKSCYENMKQEVGISECLQCNKTNIILLNPQLLSIYNELEIYCECGNLCKMQDIYNHQITCKFNMPKCAFFHICNNHVSQLFQTQGVCGPTCQVMLYVKKNGDKLNNNWNNVYIDLKKMLRDLQDKNLLNNNSNNNNASSNNVLLSNTPSQPSKFLKQIPLIKLQPPPQQLSFPNAQISEFSWDPQRKGNGIQLSNNNMTAYLQESYYVFKSVISNLPFVGGTHYWEIIIDSRTENELKIGVAVNNVFNFDSAFCDYDFGFGYYTVGQLRSGSNAAGGNYGKKFKNSGVCGCYLDMNQGTLSFSFNNEFLGVAYTHEKLKKGPIYPSISLLHHAGFTLISNKPIPSIFK